MHPGHLWWICVLLLAGTSGAQFAGERDESLGCRIENGELVDWYYLYKLPKEPSEHDSPTNGLRYVYVSSKDGLAGDALQWKPARFTVNQSESAPGSTIAPSLSNRSAILTILYNDEPSNGPMNAERGHTKGVVSTDGKTGYWLVHSVPKFPPEIGTGYSYPHTGMMYGQSFLCLSLNAPEMETVGHQLLYNEVTAYSASVPTELSDRFPMLARAAKMLPVELKAPFHSQQTVRTRAGLDFVTFAKSRQFGKDLYADWIAPALDVGLLVESWQHGAGNMPSECTGRPHSVKNVREVTVGGGKDRFATLKDHSKWAVDDRGDGRWICVGDINRQEHQKQRGGGSVCRLSPELAALYRSMVDAVEPCPKSDGTASFTGSSS